MGWDHANIVLLGRHPNQEARWRPSATGVLGIWRGSYKREGVSGIEVFKVIANHTELTSGMMQGLQLVVCLSHPNILSFISTEPQPLYIVSRWIPHGDISQFLKRHGQSSHRPLVLFNDCSSAQNGRLNPDRPGGSEAPRDSPTLCGPCPCAYTLTGATRTALWATFPSKPQLAPRRDSRA